MATASPSADIMKVASGLNGANILHRGALWPIMAIMLVLVLQLHLALTRSINWDEFHFLGQVHSFASGELTLPMQTLHVRFFAWLVPLDMTGVDQIRIARLFMLVAETVTCGAIITIARRFFVLPTALLCALAYLSAGYVFQHGWSFRTDPIATALSISALAILIRSRLSIGAIAAFAVLLGTAFMVTIKIVLFAPAFAGIAWLRLSEGGYTIRRAAYLAAGPIAAIAVAAALFAWHSLSIAPADQAAAMVDRSGGNMFVLGANPNLRFYATAAITALPFFILLAAVPIAMRVKPELKQDEKWAIIGLASMVVTPLYYLNTFPYFYAFMLAPVAIAVGVAIEAASHRYGTKLVTALFAGWAALLWVSDGPSRLDQQRSIQIAASEMFQEPVHYFDFPGFLPKHRKANFFLTTYGLKNYMKGNKPKFTELMRDKTVPLLAAVDPQFNPSLLSAMEDLPRGFEFFPEDLDALKTTYRRVWGPLYVAGVQLAGAESRQWQVWVPGTYTAEDAITIDGQPYSRGDYIQLERGTVQLSAPQGIPTGLIWGKDTAAPDMAEPQRPYWTDF